MRGLTGKEECVVRIPGRVLLRLEQRIKVPETAISTSLLLRITENENGHQHHHDTR